MSTRFPPSFDRGTEGIGRRSQLAEGREDWEPSGEEGNTVLARARSSTRSNGSFVLLPEAERRTGTIGSDEDTTRSPLEVEVHVV